MKFLLFFLTCLTAAAQPLTLNDPVQFMQPASTPASTAVTPTNLTGFSASSWWCVSSNYVTNGAVVWSTNLVNGAGWHWKNSGFEFNRPVRVAAGVNGLDYIAFTAANNTRILATNYSVSQPFDVAVVARVNAASGTSYFFEGGIIWWQQNKINKFYAGTTVSGRTNSNTGWMVFHFKYNGANSVCYTNNVQDMAGNVGANAINNLCFGGVGPDSSTSQSSTYDLAEVAVFSSNLDATARTELFSAWTNKYAISLP